MKRDPALADGSAIQCEGPLAAAGALFHTFPGFRLCGGSNQHGALVWMSRGFGIAKNDLLADDVMAVGMGHDEGQNVVALDFEALRLAGGEQGFEECEGLSAMFWKNVELEQRRAVFPRTCDGYGTEPHGFSVRFQTICEYPARAAMDRIVDDLAIHFLPIASSHREHVFGGHESRLQRAFPLLVTIVLQFTTGCPAPVLLVITSDAYKSLESEGSPLTRDTHAFCFLVLTVAGLAGCSSEAAPKQAAAPLDKIQGKALVLLNETTALDAALNAGGPSVYLVNGLDRYRLFFNKAYQVEPGQEYMAEGIYAQKAIDAIGDPDQGKHGYPLEASCGRVVRMAWPGLAFDVTDSYASSLRGKVNRFPARRVFLVTKIGPGDSSKKEEAKGDQKEAPALSVPGEKQSALLVEGPTVLPAPLWEPKGGTARCKVVIDEQGKIAELNSGAQFCEAVPWSQFRYQPTVKGGQPVRVSTEVEVRFDPKK
jgi:hypothetical protein